MSAASKGARNERPVRSMMMRLCSCVSRIGRTGMARVDLLCYDDDQETRKPLGFPNGSSVAVSVQAEAAAEAR